MAPYTLHPRDITEEQANPMDFARRKRFRRKVLLCAASLLGFVAAPIVAAADELVQPRTLIVDHSLPQEKLAAEILAARRYDTFWDNGDESLARAALAMSFIDNTLPSGRSQGVPGVLSASNAFRKAVPDLRCEVRLMIVAGDRVVTHLHFTGHFTGSFMAKAGKGQKVDFIATDIYRVTGGRIVEDWHLEDNLTFLRQIGFVAQ